MSFFWQPFFSQTDNLVLSLLTFEWLNAPNRLEHSFKKKERKKQQIFSLFFAVFVRHLATFLVFSLFSCSLFPSPAFPVRRLGCGLVLFFSDWKFPSLPLSFHYLWCPLLNSLCLPPHRQVWTGIRILNVEPMTSMPGHWSDKVGSTFQNNFFFSLTFYFRSLSILCRTKEKTPFCMLIWTFFYWKILSLPSEALKLLFAQSCEIIRGLFLASPRLPSDRVSAYNSTQILFLLYSFVILIFIPRLFILFYQSLSCYIERANEKCQIGPVNICSNSVNNSNSLSLSLALTLIIQKKISKFFIILKFLFFRPAILLPCLEAMFF